VAPNFEAVIAMAKKGHERLFPFGIVGWDIMLNEDNTPVCIEFNVRVPGTILYQYANGPYGGENSEELLEFLLDEKYQKRYIPKRFRINK
jgi:D-alanine-D-alanine ligase-like ATP-grasp enzyme